MCEAVEKYAKEQSEKAEKRGEKRGKKKSMIQRRQTITGLSLFCILME